MARTLIIKGASFSTNKVATVVFSSVPCTGIEFSTDTITITGYGTEEISYTVTPSDTTDEVTWASSNTNVVTVSDGVLTVVGVGSCTVTATCGEYSDSATVTVTMYANPDWYLGDYKENTTSHVLYWNGTSASFASTYGQGEQAGQYGIYNAQDTSGNYPVIKLPGNTGRIKISITTTTAFANSDGTKLYWMKDISAQWTASQVAYYDSRETAYNITSETEKTYTVPDGIDAICFLTKFASNQASLDAAKATIAASGFKIEFLPPAE